MSRDSTSELGTEAATSLDCAAAGKTRQCWPCAPCDTVTTNSQPERKPSRMNPWILSLDRFCNSCLQDGRGPTTRNNHTPQQLNPTRGMQEQEALR